MDARNNTANIAVCSYFHNLWKTVGILKKITELYNEGVERSGQTFEPEIMKVPSTRFEAKEGIITYLSRRARHAKKIRNAKGYVDAVLDRESTASTVMGFGITIPHGESDAATETFVAYLHLLRPVQWDHDEIGPVFMIDVLLSSRNREHLRILTMLNRHLMKEASRRELRKIRTDQKFCGCIKFLEHEN